MSDILIGIGIAFVCVGILCLILSQFELHHLVVSHYEIRSPKLNQAWDGTTFVVLADLHDNEFGEKNRDLLEQIEKIHPDMALIAGDLMVVKEWKKKDLSITENLIKELSDICPVYYANGNHEQRMLLEREKYPGWWEEFSGILRKYGVHHLTDQSVNLEKDGGIVTISGLDIDEGYYLFKGKKRKMEPEYVSHKLGKPDPKHFQILLAHTPLYVEEYAEWGADLVLAGHFHGGTIRLPILGGVMTPQMQFFTGLDKGLVIRGNTKMIVSGGLGTHSINVRLNNPPELLAVTLKAEQKS